MTKKNKTLDRFRFKDVRVRRQTWYVRAYLPRTHPKYRPTEPWGKNVKEESLQCKQDQATKEEAELVGRALVRKLNAEYVGDPELEAPRTHDELLVRDLWPYYVSYQEQRVAPGTMKGLVKVQNKLKKHAIWSTPAARIRKADFDSFFNTLTHLKPTTQRNERGTVAAFWRWATEQEWPVELPSFKCSRLGFKPEDYSTERVAFTVAELEQLMPVLEKRSAKAYLVCDVQLSTGMRQSEVRGLDKQDLGQGFILLPKKVGYNKTGRRKIACPQPLIDAMHELCPNGGPVFKGRRGAKDGRLQGDSINYHLKWACHSLGIDTRTRGSHSFRRAYVTIARDEGMTLRDISLQCGMSEKLAARCYDSGASEANLTRVSKAVGDRIAKAVGGMGGTSGGRVRAKRATKRIAAESTSGGPSPRKVAQNALVYMLRDMSVGARRGGTKEHPGTAMDKDMGGALWDLAEQNRLVRDALRALATSDVYQGWLLDQLALHYPEDLRKQKRA